MNKTRQLLHKNILQTNLADFQIGLLDKIDSIGESNKWLMFESVRGDKTSHLLAAYAYEKAFLYPGIRICIVSESKMVVEFIKEFQSKSDIGEITNNEDEFRCRIGNSQIITRSIGTGEKIGGLRPHILIFPNFISIPKDIFEQIIAGFSFREETNLPMRIILAQCDDVDLDLYDSYVKYRKAAVNQGCLLKVKREDFPDGWFK